MRFGICATPDQAADLAAQGWDYLEWPLRSTVGAMTTEEYEALRDSTAEATVRPEAWNVMLPPEILVVGPEADHAAMEKYLSKAFPRVAELGGEVVVFGSGGSRRAPEDWPLERATEQFVEACRRAGDVAAASGLTIVIEPLNRRETNLVNSVAEGGRIVQQADHPAVRLLSDLYHVAAENEPFEDTTGRGPMLAHVHVATPTERRMPALGRDEEILREYFVALRGAGYDGRVSVEAGSWDMAEAVVGLNFLRSL